LSGGIYIRGSQNVKYFTFMRLPGRTDR